MFSDTYLPTINGVATATALLAEMLAEKGHDILLVIPKPAKGLKVPPVHKRIKLEVLRSISAPMYPHFRLAAPSGRTIKVLREFRADVIHVHTPLTIGFEGVLAGKFLGIPLVQTFHTLFTHPDYLQHFGIANEQLASWVERGTWMPVKMFCRNFKVNICPTEQIRQEMKKRGIHNTVTVPVSVDVEGFAEGAKSRKENYFGGQVPVLFYLGRLSIEKNVQLILRALSNLNRKGREVRMVIVGDGPYRDRLVDLAFELGVSRQVVWCGGIPFKEIRDKGWYKAGDIFVTAGRAETFGMTAVEAQASGVPVIAVASAGAVQAVGAYGMLVKNGKDEQLVKALTAAVDRMLKPEVNKSYRIKAREGAKRFSREAVYQQYEDMYRGLIEKKR